MRIDQSLIQTEKEMLERWGGFEEPLVSICCITYNHEKYISQTLDGFLIQKTNFPFEILIHDDASTDRTAEIVRSYEKKYPNIIKPIYQRGNQGSRGKMVSRFNYDRARGKYVATCEGDDFWFDCNKLQVQTDCLEENQECKLVHGDFAVIDEHGDVVTESADTLWGNNKRLGDDCLRELLEARRVIGALTTLFSKDVLFEVLEEESEIFKDRLRRMTDLPTWLGVAARYSVAYIDEPLAAYRVTAGSASRPKSLEGRTLFKFSSMRIRNYFAKKYDCRPDVKAWLEREYYRRMIFYAFAKGDRTLAREGLEGIRKMKKPVSKRERLLYLLLVVPFLRSLFGDYVGEKVIVP